MEDLLRLSPWSERRQIAEPHKYCLVRVIVFFGICFSLLLVLTGWEFWLNSLYPWFHWV